MDWIVVNTKPCCEEKAYSNLIRQGYNVFAPKILKTVSRFNKLKQILTPLFPGYIFVGLLPSQNWTKINNTYGVKKILKFNEKLCFLPTSLLLELRKKCDQKGIFLLRNSFKKGQIVSYVKNNNFLFKVSFSEYIDAKRSYVLLDFLKNKIKTQVDNKFLEPVF